MLSFSLLAVHLFVSYLLLSVSFDGLPLDGGMHLFYSFSSFYSYRVVHVDFYGVSRVHANALTRENRSAQLFGWLHLVWFAFIVIRPQYGACMAFFSVIDRRYHIQFFYLSCELSSVMFCLFDAINHIFLANYRRQIIDIHNRHMMEA